MLLRNHYQREAFSHIPKFQISSTSSQKKKISLFFFLPGVVNIGVLLSTRTNLLRRKHPIIHCIVPLLNIGGRIALVHLSSISIQQPQGFQFIYHQYENRSGKVQQSVSSSLDFLQLKENFFFCRSR